MQHHIHHHTQPAQLEKYSFLWSEARLIIAALALFLGGVPPVLVLFGGSPALAGLVFPLLKLAWIISGAASLYMFYRWNGNGRKLFGGNQPKDLYAFFVSVISGLNLGVVGVFGVNIGMKALNNYLVFVIVGVLYILASVHLNKRWREHGEKIF